MTSRELLAEMQALVDYRNAPGELGDRARLAFSDRFRLHDDVRRGCFGITFEDVASRAEAEFGGAYFLEYFGVQMVAERDPELAALLEEHGTQASLIGTALDFDDQKMFRECTERYELLMLEILRHCDERYPPFELTGWD